MADTSIMIFKCLSDKSRLTIINSLLQKPMYVELLSQTLNLAPSTVSFHLKKLEEAGLVKPVKEQYYTVYYINSEILESTLIKLIQNNDTDDKLQREREESYRKKVVDSFFYYGKLKSIPVQSKKRKIVLEEIGKKFEPKREYTEKEVNLIVADIYDDFCTIRREMVDFGVFTRSNGIYKLYKEKE